MDKIGEVLIGLFTGVITVSIISVIVSKKAQTPQVIQAGATALSAVVAAAVSPITTAGTNANYGGYTFGSALNFSQPTSPLPSGH